MSTLHAALAGMTVRVQVPNVGTMTGFLRSESADEIARIAAHPAPDEVAGAGEDHAHELRRADRALTEGAGWLTEGRSCCDCGDDDVCSDCRGTDDDPAFRERILAARLDAVEADLAAMHRINRRRHSKEHDLTRRAEKAEAERDALRTHVASLYEQVAAVEAERDNLAAWVREWQKATDCVMPAEVETLRARDERVWDEGFNAAVGDARDEARNFVRAITRNPYKRQAGESDGE